MSMSNSLNPHSPNRLPPRIIHHLHKSTSSSDAQQPIKDSLLLSTPTITKPHKKVYALKPGFSPLDWARLKISRRPTPFKQNIPISEIQRHNSKSDCWTIINNKVYDITPYLNFHPGGVFQIMRCAGSDATKLFMETHPWVNAEYLLDTCLIGSL